MDNRKVAPKKSRKPTHGCSQKLPIEVYDVRSDGLDCDFCTAQAEVMVILQVQKSVAAFDLCAKHRIELEGGLRAARKYFVRGGRV